MVENNKIETKREHMKTHTTKQLADFKDFHGRGEEKMIKTIGIENIRRT